MDFYKRFDAITPKAFANFSPWLELSDNHGIKTIKSDSP
jgi:hypothetical protein